MNAQVQYERASMDKSPNHGVKPMIEGAIAMGNNEEMSIRKHVIIARSYGRMCVYRGYLDVGGRERC